MSDSQKKAVVSVKNQVPVALDVIDAIPRGQIRFVVVTEKLQAVNTLHTQFYHVVEANEMQEKQRIVVDVVLPRLPRFTTVSSIDDAVAKGYGYETGAAFRKHLTENKGLPMHHKITIFDLGE